MTLTARELLVVAASVLERAELGMVSDKLVKKMISLIDSKINDLKGTVACKRKMKDRKAEKIAMGYMDRCLSLRFHLELLLPKKEC